MNIRQAADVSGLTADTIRFCERQGFLPAPPRQLNGYREYTPKHIATLRLAKAFRGLSVPLAEVTPLLKLAYDGACGEIREQLTSSS